MGSGMGRGFGEAPNRPAKVSYILDQNSNIQHNLNKHSAADFSPSLPPLLSQLQTQQYASPFPQSSGPTLPPISNLQITTTISLPRRDLQRNSSSPVQRYCPYERPPTSQRASPTQRVNFPRTSSERSPKANYQSPMHLRQEANQPPLFAPLNIYQPTPIKEEPQANSGGNSAMLISSLINEIPTKPVTELYSLRVRQQPIDARMCGNGLADRRHIDPPPVVQLFLNDPNMNLIDLNKYLVTLHCLLWNVDTDSEDRLTEDGHKRLEGNHSANPAIGPDELNDMGCFFIFPDLSCRNKGKWRLMFKLSVTNLDTPQGQTTPFMATVLSDVFQVSEATGANKFRGMSESTPLTKALKAMGQNVKLRRGHSTKTVNGTVVKGSSEDDEGDGDEEDEDVKLRPSSSKRRKRGGKS